MVKVMIQKMYEDVDVPKYAKEGDAGMDIRAYTPESEILIHGGERKIIPTGIKVAIPKDYEIQVRPRSGMALKKGVTVLNTPGTIDCVTFDTEIRMLEGTEKAIDVFRSDKKRVILSYNEEQDSVEEDIIEDAWIVKNISLIKIETEESVIFIPFSKEIFTKRGWVRADALRDEDEILSFS